MIRFTTLKDDKLRLAQLVYETDNIIPFVFGSKEFALLKIQALIEKQDNAFSFQNILVYENEAQIIQGILLAYAPSEKNKHKENEIYSCIFSTKELIVLWLKSLFLRSIENKSEIDGLYIQNISVDAATRGQGIGSQLINSIEKVALTQHYFIPMVRCSL